METIIKIRRRKGLFSEPRKMLFSEQTTMFLSKQKTAESCQDGPHDIRLENLILNIFEIFYCTITVHLTVLKFYLRGEGNVV